MATQSKDLYLLDATDTLTETLTVTTAVNVGSPSSTGRDLNVGANGVHIEGHCDMTLGKRFYIGPQSDDGNRLNFFTAGGHAYMDYYDNFYFRSGSSGSGTKVTFSNSGKITSASTDSYNAITAAGGISANSYITSTDNTLILANSSGGNLYIRANGPGSTTGQIRLIPSQAQFYGTANSTSISTGAVKILGGLGISFAVYAGGTMTATDHINTSDRRKKTLIEDYKPKPINVRFREFEWKDTGVKGLGFIADEVEKTHPEFVVKGETPEDMDAVKYQQILVAKVAYQEQEISDLKAKLDLVIKKLGI